MPKLQLITSSSEEMARLVQFLNTEADPITVDDQDVAPDTPETRSSPADGFNDALEEETP
jgi:hypothetical protein